jgi:hypothetical protein
VRHLALVAALFALACSDQQRINKKLREEACTKNLDCYYGLECIDTAQLPDGGPAPAAKTCQYKSFGECDSDSAAPSGQPQCLSGQKCRDGHCTVQCAGPKDCKEGEVCKIGICQKGGTALNQCYDNRDCAWPQTCFYGQCVTRTETMRCHTDLDCGYGFRCINGLCQ